MATGKKSFVLYCDLIHEVDHLTNEEKGMLFQHLLEYVNDMNPILKDRVILGSWKHIERQLKRDLKKYEEIREKRRQAGAKGGKQSQANQANASFANQSQANQAVNDNVNVTVNDNVNVNDSVSNTPTREEVEKEICTILFARGIASVSFPVEDLAQRFHDNYESKGWQINGQKIVKWQPRLNQWVMEELKKDNSTLETQQEREAREFMQAIKKQATNEYLYGNETRKLI